MGYPRALKDAARMGSVLGAAVKGHRTLERGESWFRRQADVQSIVAGQRGTANHRDPGIPIAASAAEGVLMGMDHGHRVAVRTQPVHEPGHGHGHAVDLGRVGLGHDTDMPPTYGVSPVLCGAGAPPRTGRARQRWPVLGIDVRGGDAGDDGVLRHGSSIETSGTFIERLRPEAIVAAGPSRPTMKNLLPND
jgi:hypothetical protein